MTDTYAMTRRERADRNPPHHGRLRAVVRQSGGKARAKALTAKERKAIGKEGAVARAKVAGWLERKTWPWSKSDLDGSASSMSRSRALMIR